MSFFAGVVVGGRGQPDREGWRWLAAIAATHGGAPPALWTDDRACLAHVPWLRTPEDRAERMPLPHAGGRRVLLLDGRLDNRDELIGWLGLGTADGMIADGVVLGAALERWGDEACRRLRGDFAFAQWDTAERRLLLACDQVGGRSLYFHAGPDRLCFATTVPALLDFPGIPRDLDEATLARAALNYAEIPRGRTMFRAIAMLPSAGRLTWRDGAMRSERYWTPDFSPRIRYRRDGDYVEAARELLDRAVAERLRSDGPVAFDLSGGLDSSGVTATAARLTAPSPLHAVTLTPDPAASLPRRPERRTLDEWADAARVAALHPAIVHHRAAAAMPGAGDEDDFGFFRHCGWPVRHVFNAQWFACRRPVLRRIGAGVVVTGTPGNATLSWDGRAALLDRLWGPELPAALAELIRLHRTDGRVWSLTRGQMIRPLVPEWAATAFRRLRSAADPWLIDSAIHPDLARALRAGRMRVDRGLGPEIRGAGHRQRLWLHEAGAYSRAIRAGHRRADGFETREPLGDLRLVEFCAGIPPRQFLADGVTRWLARRVLADRLPAAVVAGTRMGVQNPDWFDWMSRRRSDIVAELERLEHSAVAARILDLPRLRRLAADWPADADAAEARRLPLAEALGRGFRIGRFIRWAEGGG